MRKKLYISTLVAFMFLMASCATLNIFGFDKQGSELHDMKTTYEAIITDNGVRHRAGSLKKEQLQEVVAAGTVFHREYNVAMNSYLLKAPDVDKHIVVAQGALTTLKAVNVKHGGK
jgi:predicted small secreted protein